MNFRPYAGCREHVVLEGKVVVVGDIAVGKTALIGRFVDGGKLPCIFILSFNRFCSRTVISIQFENSTEPGRCVESRMRLANVFLLLVVMFVQNQLHFQLEQWRWMARL